MEGFKLMWKAPISIYQLLMVLTMFIAGRANGQTDPYVDSLSNVALLSDDPLERAVSYLQLSRRYMFENPDTAEIFGQESLSNFELKGNEKGQADALLCIGVAHSLRGNYLDAALSFHQSMDIQIRILDTLGLSNSLMNLGNIYGDQAQTSKALNYYLQALRLKEILGNHREIGKISDNIGTLYTDIKDYNLARQYHLKALQHNIIIADTLSIANTLNNLGIVEKVEGNLSKAISYHKRSLEYKTKTSDVRGMGTSYHNLGTTYAEMGRLDSALYYFDRSISKKKIVHDKFGLSQSLREKANTLERKGKYSEAIKFAEEGLTIADSIKNMFEVHAIHKTLYKIYRSTNNSSKALEHFEKHIYFRDSLMNSENAVEFARIESGYKLEKKLEENKRREEIKKEREKNESKRRNFRQYLLILGIFSCTMFPFLLFANRIHNSKVRFFTGYVSLLIFFEFLLVIIDPWVDGVTGGVPIPKLLVNIVLAGIFAPVIHSIENKIGKRGDN